MRNKIALLLTIILVIVDINLLMDYIDRPSQDPHHGGMGDGLMDLFAMGVGVSLILYLMIFLLLYFRKKFTAANVFCLILLVVNVFFLAQMILVG